MSILKGAALKHRGKPGDVAYAHAEIAIQQATRGLVRQVVQFDVRVQIFRAIRGAGTIEIRNDVENSIWAVTYPAVHGPIVMAVRASLAMRTVENINDYR